MCLGSYVLCVNVFLIMVIISVLFCPVPPPIRSCSIKPTKAGAAKVTQTRFANQQRPKSIQHHRCWSATVGKSTTFSHWCLSELSHKPFPMPTQIAASNRTQLKLALSVPLWNLWILKERICYTFFLQRIRSDGNFGPGGISGLISNLQLSPSSSKLSKIFLIKRKSSSTWLGTKTTLMSFRSVFKILRSLKLRAGESWNIL